jgi:hypothetical protein
VTDTNVPNDTSWAFHSVAFDANGGEVEKAFDLTVEGGRLGCTTRDGGRLPVPTRTGYAFGGWWTEAEGGTEVGAATDFSQIKRVYAHWAFDDLYRCVDGDHASWTKGTSDALPFRFERGVDDDATFGHFAGVRVDGVELAEESFDAHKGSVVVDLKPAFLETLAVGDHTVTALFDDGEGADATFSVLAAPDEPVDPADPTGDSADDQGGTEAGSTDEARADRASGKTARTSDDLLPAMPFVVASVAFLAAAAFARRQERVGR